jgi:hypothetical protein
LEKTDKLFGEELKQCKRLEWSIAIDVCILLYLFVSCPFICLNICNLCTIFVSVYLYSFHRGCTNKKFFLFRVFLG